jgi:hypothetical protein
LEVREKLNNWVERGLISIDQRDSILAYESSLAVPSREPGHGRFAEAISTVGAAVAIAATVGIISIFIEDWSSAQAMVVSAIGAIVMIAAAWELVRNGWGAPAGLCAVCGLTLIPLSLGSGADVAGWWPEESAAGSNDETFRSQQQVIGSVLLLSILPGIGVMRLGLRQAFAALPLAAWYGTTLLFTNVFENIPLTLTQAILGALLAAYAVFIWRPDEAGRGTAWWLQLGGLLLAAQAIAFSAFEDQATYALLGLCAAAIIFTVGVIRNRTTWIVVGALPAVIPAGRLVFEYFQGLAGLLIVAIIGMAIAFLPLIILRRRQSLPSA